MRHRLKLRQILSEKWKEALQAVLPIITIVLVVMCVVREFLGSGKFGGGLLGGGGLGSAPGIVIFPEEFGIKLLTLPVGGFLTLGALIAAMQWALAKSEKKKEAK